MGSYLSRLLLWPEPEEESSSEKNEESAEEEEHEEVDVLSLVPARRYPQRALPYNVLDQAADLVARMGHANLTLSESDPAVLEVELPTKRKARHRQVRRWHRCFNSETIACGVRQLMQEDGLIAIRSAPELCARYPGYFWNLVFYCQKDADAVYEFLRQELAT